MDGTLQRYKCHKISISTTVHKTSLLYKCTQNQFTVQVYTKLVYFDNWKMKGEIQFWGQTHRHTDICTSRAASSQLKIWIFPFCQRMSLKIKLKPLSLNFRRDTRVLDRYFYLYSLQSTYKCYFWYFILGKNAYKNSQCGIKSQKKF